MSRSRSVSMMGVKGWYAANQGIPAGIEAVGTNPLPRKSRSIRGMGRLLAWLLGYAAMREGR